MDGTLVLVLLALVMLVGSYVAGSIPLNVSMSEDKLHKVTVLGAGLLVGTALAVIVPEGVRALFDVPGVPNVSAAAALPATSDPPHDLHSVIGVSLVLGFVFMLLVEQLSARWGEGATATVGLVVHAAADGIALGAAATTAHADVELVVFLAIMLHKAPAAFGLVTFLLHAGLDRARIRRHLAVFACAAPALALLTYFGLGNEGKQTLSAFNATGIAMLFSAGTFLYVATVHVLPELTHGAGSGAHSGHAHAHAHTGHSLLPSGAGGGGGGGGERKRTGLQPAEVLLLAAGALLPPFLTLGHKH